MVAIDRRRHARQLLLTEIGESGQARLCAARVRIAANADSRAAQVARDYLQRAGLQVSDAPVPAPASAPTREISVPDTAAVQALAGRPELEHAAAALAGAFAAVEAIKSVLDLPHGATLAADLSLAAGAGA